MHVESGLYKIGRLLGILLVFATLAACGWKVRAEDRPNILVILCDDLGYGDLACYGHPHIRTPHLDRMAAEGIRFTDFYSAAPVCSPSRVGLLTGRSPNRAGVFDWIPEAKAARPDARDQVHMRGTEVTIPRLLKEAGYATAMAGKWHCNSKFNVPDQPQPGDSGFDHWLATQNNAFPTHANPTNFVRNGAAVGAMAGYSCQLVAREGIDWISGHVKQNPDQPFFFYMAFHEPHEPIASPQEMVMAYRPVAVTEEEATYFANVENMDHAVGKVLQTLEDLGIDENTLVVFTSDNGPETLNRYTRANYSWGRPDPLRGMKLWTTEAGFRVAGIMRWPDRIQPGQTIHHPVSSLDFLPTFCALAGIRPPPSLKLDGADFLPVLQNQPVRRSKPLVWAYYNAINEHRVAMRSGRWKVLARLDLPKMQNLHAGNIGEVRQARLSDLEIYDLESDIREANNLAGTNPALLKILGEEMNRHYGELLEGSHIWTAEVAE